MPMMLRRFLWIPLLALGACGGAQAGPETAETAETAGPAALALPNQAQPEEDVTTGGPPSAADLEAAAAAGYTLVVDLRTPSEDGQPAARAAVEAQGMRYVSIPVAGPDGVTPEAAAALDEALAGAGGPAIVHCASGNRAGGLMALRAFASGASVEEALALGRSAGLTRLEGAVRERLTGLCEADPERPC